MATALDYYNDPALTTALNEANTAQSQASAYQSAASLLPAKLKEAIQSKLDYNRDIIEQKNKAMAEYFAAPSAARVKYEDIFNPFAREKLVAQETANAYAPYATLSDILGQRMGTIGDLVSSGTGAFNSAVTTQQGNATLARQKYQDLLDLAKLRSQANIDQQKLNQDTDGVGNGLDLASILKLLGVDLGGQTDEESKPTTKLGPVSAVSPKGKWMWDYLSNDWVPIVD